MNWKDEIVEEVRSRREAYAAQFNYDIALIVEDLKWKEAKHPDRLADPQPFQPHVELVDTTDDRDR